MSMQVFLLALALAMDALAVSIGLGLCQRMRLWRLALRVALAFGGFQAGMTLLGGISGGMVSAWFEALGNTAAALVLAAVGAHMLVEAMRARPESDCPDSDPDEACKVLGSGRLLVLALATSIDAYGAGLGLAFIGDELVPAAAVIGIVAAVIAAAGALGGGHLASRSGRRLSKWAEVLGALVLLGIAVRISLGS